MNTDKKYGKRLRLCRLIAGYETMGQAREATGLSTGSISDYENDRRLPLLPAIIAMADAYDVSVDFLLGLTDTTEHDGRTISI